MSIAGLSQGVAAVALHESDSVATALAPLAKGSEVAVGYPGRQIRIQVAEDIPIYHKVALVDLPAAAEVRKHGHVIGHTTEAVPAGALVHVHNLAGKAAGA